MNRITRYIELKSNKLMKYDIELSIFDMNYPGSKSSFGCPEGHQQCLEQNKTAIENKSGH